jgi:hypothetical protein
MSHSPDVAERCKRLIENALVVGNSLDRTQKIAAARDADTRTALRESVTAGSVVSRHHSNLLGE